MAESPRPRLTTETVGAVAVVRFHDPQISDPVVIADIRQHLYSLLDGGQQRMVLCFNDVELLVTEMLGVLIGVRRKVEALGGGLRLCGFQPLPRQAMRITGLEQIFPIDDDEGAALAALA